MYKTVDDSEYNGHIHYSEQLDIEVCRNLCKWVQFIALHIYGQLNAVASLDFVSE